MQTPFTTDDSPLNHFYSGARACFPVAVSIIAYGLVWGMLARNSNLSLLEVVLMSNLVFAGSSQFVALELWTTSSATLPIGALILAAFIVNLRYLLLTATLRPLFPPGKLGLKASLMHFVTDENWAMTVAAMSRGRASLAFLLGGGAVAFVTWNCATLSGYGLGSVIDDPAQWGLDFAFTATFLALLLGMWKGKSDLLPWLVAAIVAIISAKFIEGSWYIIIGGIAGSLAGALAETRKNV